ncbi:MAG: hypothetical protein ACXW0Z_01150 [Gemmatirosa sp.]
MTMLRRALAAAVTVGAVAGLSAASAIRMRVHPDPAESRLRVSFSARPERVETCRAVGADELAQLPEHMRQSVVCEGAAARYRLDVWRDGAPLATAVVRGGGLRHDRQLYVLRDLPVASGRATIEVRLTRLDSARAPTGVPPTGVPPTDSDDDETVLEDRSGEERRRRMADEVPASLVLRETLTLAPREVLLVTYDQEARRLRAVRGAR